MFQEDYQTIDFRPAPAGWYVVHIDTQANWCRFTVPAEGHVMAGTNRCATCLQPKTDRHHFGIYRTSFPGWLIQEEKYAKDRRVIPATQVEDGSLCEMDLDSWASSEWYIAGPDDAQPTVEQIIDERDAREEQKRIVIAKQAHQQMGLAA